MNGMSIFILRELEIWRMHLNKNKKETSKRDKDNNAKKKQDKPILEQKKNKKTPR